MTEETTAVNALEEEGDIAADYLEELLDICDLDGDIDIDVENGRAAVAIVSEEYGGRWLKKLVGNDGAVLDALQELTRLAVQAKTGERSRLMLDVAGHRAGIRDELTAEALEAIAEVKSSGEAVEMRPMNPFERKVVHDAVKDSGLTSESEGAEPRRFVVILPAAGGSDESGAGGDDAVSSEGAVVADEVVVTDDVVIADGDGAGDEVAAGDDANAELAADADANTEAVVAADLDENNDDTH